MMSPYRFDPALVEPLERARLSAFLYHLLQRSAAANAVIGVVTTQADRPLVRGMILSAIL